jgi:aspartyl-tRNA(Asn)/glutamyl-tRNA(Gln) amidotransferase subunit A
MQHRVLIRLTLGTSAFENYFLQAQRVRALVRNDFDAVFAGRAENFLWPRSRLRFQSQTGASEGIDVLLHPSAIRTAPTLPQPGTSRGGPSIDAYVQDVLTVPASLAGLPAMSVPCGHGADGWPVGASVVGQWGYDAVVCRVGQTIEACVQASPSS